MPVSRIFLANVTEVYPVALKEVFYCVFFIRIRDVSMERRRHSILQLLRELNDFIQRSDECMKLVPMSDNAYNRYDGPFVGEDSTTQIAYIVLIRLEYRREMRSETLNVLHDLVQSFILGSY